MTYHATTRGCAHIGIPDDDAHVTCNYCGLARYVLTPRSKGPPTWLLRGKPAPGWRGGQHADGTRWDQCPECFDRAPRPEDAPLRPRKATP